MSENNANINNIQSKGENVQKGKTNKQFIHFVLNIIHCASRFPSVRFVAPRRAHFILRLGIFAGIVNGFFAGILANIFYSNVSQLG